MWHVSMMARSMRDAAVEMARSIFRRCPICAAEAQDAERGLECSWSCGWTLTEAEVIDVYRRTIWCASVPG